MLLYQRIGTEVQASEEEALRMRDPKLNEVADVSAELQTGSEEFCIEEARAIHGLGKDDYFYVDH